jgi:hypothetical protein
LTLPPNFGPVYVGETFSCTLSANNDSTSPESNVRNVSVSVEVQSPSQRIPLQLYGPGLALLDDDAPGSILKSGESLQRIVKHDLTEKGAYTLSVTVSYTENAEDGTDRSRSFRKLYQFSAQELLTVRTKMSEVPIQAGAKNAPKPSMRVLLEAQLENAGEGPISLAVSNKFSLLNEAKLIKN